MLPLPMALREAALLPWRVGVAAAERGYAQQLTGLLTDEQGQMRLAEVVPMLSSSADALGRAAGWMGDLAGRFPMSRRRPIPLGP